MKPKDDKCLYLSPSTPQSTWSLDHNYVKGAHKCAMFFIGSLAVAKNTGFSEEVPYSRLLSGESHTCHLSDIRYGCCVTGKESSVFQ